ncbi:MAG: aa3-type cytochrome c oxidase subunit IV [Acetobacteraceae bacterium]|nr:aa3-type cytochrome c oxidase subunit IV [Acetobacteraceae bacterium]
MAHAPSNSPASVTEEAFTADRQRAFAGFCSGATVSVIVSAVVLVLMAVFLVR